MNPLLELYKERKGKSKEEFEANFLDGDKIQEGQTLSSEFCFEAILASQKSDIISVIEAIEKWGEGNRKEESLKCNCVSKTEYHSLDCQATQSNTKPLRIYNSAFADLLNFLKEAREKINKE